MNTFSNVFSAEMIKTKHTVTPWLTLGGAVFIPLLILAVYLNNPSKVVITEAENPWIVLTKSTFQFGSVFIIPFFVMVVTSLIVNIEFKSNTWKHILVLPILKDYIFLGKLVVVFLAVIAFYFLYDIFLLADAMVFKSQLTQFGRTRRPFDWNGLVKLSFRSLVSILPILAIHFWLSLRIKNIILVISIGLLGLCIAIVLSSPGTWDDVFYFPYAFPAILSYRLNSLQHYKVVPYSIYSVAFFVSIIFLCYADFKANFRG